MPRVAAGDGPGTLARYLLVRIMRPQRRLGWYACTNPGNFNAPLLMGLPLFSAHIVLPFILAPLVCTALSWTALVLHWVPAVAYPLANGTPESTGLPGNRRQLGCSDLSCMELGISTAIYYPFVKWAELREASVMKRNFVAWGSFS